MKFTKKHRELIGNANKGKKRTKAMILHQSKTMKNLYATGKLIPFNTGRKFSASSRRKMSETRKRMWQEGTWIPPNKGLIPFDRKAWEKNYRKTHKEYFNMKGKEWRQSKCGKAYVEQTRNHRRLYLRQYEKTRREKDIQYKLKRYLRCRVWVAFNLYSIYGKVMSSKKYGINYSSIVKHLMKTLPKDYAERKYHIDHVIPLCRFDLTNPKEVAIAFAPVNHQWLPAEVNLMKSDKIYSEVVAT